MAPGRKISSNQGGGNAHAVDAGGHQSYKPNTVSFAMSVPAAKNLSSDECSKFASEGDACCRLSHTPGGGAGFGQRLNADTA